MQNQNVRLVVSFIIGIIVGLLGAWLWTHGNNSTVVSDNDTLSGLENASSTDLMTQGSNGIVVENQAAGSRVTVAQVVFEKPGWVAIHDMVDGKPGRILGAKLFDAGKHTGTVELLRQTVNGRTYAAMLHSDDGNYKNFSVAADKPLLDDAGKEIMTTFTVGAVAGAQADITVLNDSSKD